MRALVVVAVLAGCTEHGEGGGPVGPDGSDFPILDAGACAPGARCVANQSCAIEGHASCNEPPPSGGCDCVGGTFVCFSSCPTGCPELEVPHDGDSCDGVQNGAICPYDDPAFSGQRVECTCTGGVFACSP